MHILTFPLPLRHRIDTPDGWATEQWQTHSVVEALNSGGWFAENLPYEFANRATAEFAWAAQRTFQELRYGPA